MIVGSRYYSQYVQDALTMFFVRQCITFCFVTGPMPSMGSIRWRHRVVNKWISKYTSIKIDYSNLKKNNDSQNKDNCEHNCTMLININIHNTLEK